jgi:hypothetical protein
MSRALSAFLLVFAFLFAQAGWAAHTASHVVAASHNGDQGLPADTPCELCVGYAQVAGGAPLPDAPSLPVCNARYETPDSIAALPVSRAIYRSRARAPPAFS